MYAERFGVSDAAKEKGVLAIGNVIDTQADYPETVVASALWHFEPTLDKAIAAVKAGTFKAADYGVYSFMKEGGCSLAPLGTFEGKVRGRRDGKGRREGKGDQGRLAGHRDQRRGAEVELALSYLLPLRGEGGGEGPDEEQDRPFGVRAAFICLPADSPVNGDEGRSHQRRLVLMRRPSGNGRSSAYSGITKRFGRSLLTMRSPSSSPRGEVVALLGENGAGKTTLMNILFGHYVADEGTVEAFGKPLPPGDPSAALEAGIGMVHQHFYAGRQHDGAGEHRARHAGLLAPDASTA